MSELVTAETAAVKTVTELVAVSLCLTAQDRYVRRLKALAMGVYLGYMLARQATEIVGRTPGLHNLVV